MQDCLVYSEMFVLDIHGSAFYACLFCIQKIESGYRPQIFTENVEREQFLDELTISDVTDHIQFYRFMETREFYNSVNFRVYWQILYNLPCE